MDNKVIAFIKKIGDTITPLIALITVLYFIDSHNSLSQLVLIFQNNLQIYHIILFVVYACAYHVFAYLTNIYHFEKIKPLKYEYIDIVKIIFFSSIMLLLMIFNRYSFSINKQTFLNFVIINCVFIFLFRLTLRIISKHVYKARKNTRNVLIIGWNKRVYDLSIHILNSPQLGCNIVGFLDVFSEEVNNRRFDLFIECLGAITDFDYIVDKMEIDEVFICLPIRSFYEHIDFIIKSCEEQGIAAHIVLDLFDIEIANAQFTEFDGIPLITFKTSRINPWQSCVKRIFDLTVAASMLIILSPILLIISLLIKSSSPGGPVFFVQTRVGYNRRRFRMIKFRTMVPNAAQMQYKLESSNEVQGPIFKIKDDPRIIPIGHFLRKTSIDEFPQLFNVIRGDMSLVGPRPLPLRDVARFEESWLKRRFSVKPGITCLWQVNGRSNMTFDQWIKQDLEYIDHWSFWLDIKILAKTIPAVLRGKGAY